MRKRKEYYARNQLPKPVVAQDETTAVPNASEATVTSSNHMPANEKEHSVVTPSGAVNGNDDEKISLSLEYSYE